MNSLGLLLLATLGSASSSVTGGGSSAYEHSFSLANTNTHQSLTIAMKDPQSAKRFGLCTIEKFTITIEANQYVKVVATVKGKKGATATLTPSYSADPKLLAKMATLKLASDEAGLSGASARTVRKVEFTISKNLEEEPSLGSIEPNDFINGSFAVEGIIESTFDNTTDYQDDALAGTTKAMQITVEDTSNDISGNASNAYPTLEFVFSKVKYTEWSRTTGNNDVVKQSAGFKALYSLDDAKMLSATLINTTSSL